MDTLNPITAITAEIEASEGVEHIGMLSVKSANRAIDDAAKRPDPQPLYKTFWYEGEVSCLFADSNLGKSIYAVQIADDIARYQPVLYLDCELSEKQFEMRYCDPISGARHYFPEQFYRAEIDSMRLDIKDYEDNLLSNIEEAAIKLRTRCLIIDNLTYLCNSSDKGVDAGLFMMKLMQIKKRHGWAILIIAHTPKRSLSSAITQNDLAGSKKLYNFFDSVFAIGKSAKNPRLRYVKQLKVRAGAFEYGPENVIVYEIVKTGGYTHFEFREYSSERAHLKIQEEPLEDELETTITRLMKENKTIRQIAEEVGVSKSKVGRIVQKISRQEEQK